MKEVLPEKEVKTQGPERLVRRSFGGRNRIRVGAIRGGGGPNGGGLGLLKKTAKISQVGTGLQSRAK